MRSISVLLMLLLSTATAFSAPKYATSDEFSSAIVGKAISSKDKKGKAFTATFKPGGKGSFQKEGKKAAKFKWTFAKDTVCWDFGDFKECNKVEILTPTSANFYDATSGGLNNAYTVK